MSKRASIAVLCLLAILFLVENRAAYRAYFDADDLDNLSWNRSLPVTGYIKGVVSPVFSRTNFRPVGHFYFHVLEDSAGTWFPAYVGVLQAVHLLNAALVFYLGLRLGFSPPGALVSAAIVLINPATFDAYWRPMYVFDVLCGCFVALSFLAWVARRWVWSLVCFWLAYKSKELAIMLPVALILYEWLGRREGERQWKPLVAFLAVSLCFGIQALVANTGTNDAYSLELSATGLGRTVGAYQIALGSALVSCLIDPSRRTCALALGAIALLVPLMLLPNRVSAVYSYVPLLFAALALGSSVATKPVWVAAGLSVLYLGSTHVQLRPFRATQLHHAKENRAYVESLASYLREPHEPIGPVIYDGAPPRMHAWGIAGALRYLTNGPEREVISVDSPRSRELLTHPGVATFAWDEASSRLTIIRPVPGHPQSYIEISRGTPIWDLGEGWYGREGSYRWIAGTAAIRMYRPPGAKQFEACLNMSPVHVGDVGTVRTQVWINNVMAGTIDVADSGIICKRIQLPSSTAEGPVDLKLVTSPEYHPRGDSRILGIPLRAFGFVE